MADLVDTQVSFNVNKPPAEARAAVEAAFSTLGGKMTEQNNERVSAKFGNKLMMRLLGIPFTSRRTIPKIAEADLSASDGSTAVALTVKNDIGWKLGGLGNDKVNQAVAEAAEAIKELSQE